MKDKNLLQQINREIKENIAGLDCRSSNFKKYMSKNPLKQFFINRFLSTVVETLESVEVGKVLDIGCGEGYIVKSLSLNYNVNINACDFNEGVLTVANVINPDAKFFAADVSFLPIADNVYDLVVCCEVLEHLQTPQVALKEIKRVSKGLCLLSVPYEPFFSTMNFMSGKNLRAFGNDPGHVQKWTKKGFGKMVSEEFEIISLTSCIPWVISFCRAKV